MIKMKEKLKHQQPHPRRFALTFFTLSVSLSLLTHTYTQIGNGGFCLFGNLKIGSLGVV